MIPPSASARPDVGSTVGAPGVGPYLHLAPHAQGGLGEVFTALDPELHRSVAIKRLQDKHALNPDMQRRFLLEAEITARLEHPGVVPVYGLTRDDRNSPAYAMRFIQGQTLAQAIAEYYKGPPDPVGFRRLLQTYLQVCQTVAYAHSRGVIHRDLKPQNVMLGKYGETLVVDWGLAKVVGRPEEARTVAAEETLIPESVGLGNGSETLLGTAIGTPAYMSPEQAAGRWDVIAQASDIYSLGGILYTLLSNKTPLEKSNWPEMQQKIQQGDFPRPRQIRADAPRALEAVCLKAMAGKPADRYASVDTLAADVEHWLADEPVTAYREPLGTRMRRWARRNRTVVTAGLALLLAGLISAGVGVAMLSHKNREIEKERNEARQQRDLARQAVDDFFVAVSENTLLKSPQAGLQPLRKQLLELALKYYQAFADQHSDDPSLRADLAQAYFRVATINREAGSKEAAIKAFQKAIPAYDELAQNNPDKPWFTNNLARCYRWLGVSLWECGHHAESFEPMRQAISIGERLVQNHKENPEFQRDLAWSYNNFAILQEDIGDFDKAIGSYQKAVATWNAALETKPRCAEYMNGLARTHSNLGEQLILIGKFDEARDNSQKAVSIQEELVKEFRENLNFKIELILSLSNLGNMYHVNNQLVLAQDFYERGLRLATTLAKDNPAVTDLQVRYALLTNYFGLLLVTTGHHKEALDRFNDVLDLQNRNQEVPSNTYMRTHLGRAKALHELGQINDALLATKASIHIGETDPGGQPLASFNLACARALYSVLIAKQSKELTQAEQAAKQDYSDKALKDLKHAVAGGLRNVALIRSDPDLMTLKERPDFKQLLHELEADQKLGK